MSDRTAVDVLSELLRCEYESLLLRLGEAEPYVSNADAADRVRLDQLVADVQAHCRDFVTTIQELRGAPQAPNFAMDTGGIHYMTLNHLRPAIIQAIETLIVAYEAAGNTGVPDADRLISRNVAIYRRHLEEFKA